MPTVPSPKPEQFGLAIEELAKNNAQATGYDVSRVMDDSFVRKAAERGLDKA